MNLKRLEQELELCRKTREQLNHLASLCALREAGVQAEIIKEKQRLESVFKLPA